jgi:hypothetical protein
LTLGDEAMLRMRVTPACCRAALVVAIVGITYKQDNTVYSIKILNTVKSKFSVPPFSEYVFLVSAKA